MPLLKPEEKGGETNDGPLCIHCVHPDGTMKSCEEIFAGGVAFFTLSTGTSNRTLAEKLVRKTMRGLPFWQKHPCPCLEGAVASDEEFGAAMAHL